MRSLYLSNLKIPAMSDSIVQVPKLPRTGFADGEQVADPDGNIWEYNAETREWFLRGKFDPIPSVSEDENGLVTPDIYRKLLLIQELLDRGVPFDIFKLKSSVENPYFFYFQSSDGLIQFQPEENSVLRMEIDKNRLAYLLMRRCCVGPKGRVGPQGKRGVDGKKAANEVFRVPVIDGNVFSLKVKVASPIDTPISLRVFNASKTQVAEFLVHLDGSDLEFSLVDGLTIEDTGLHVAYDKSTQILDASIPFVTSSDMTLWRYKARQRGADGDEGADGKPYLEVVDQLIEDNAVESRSAVVSLRKSGTTDLRALSAEMHTDICVSKISAIEGNMAPGDFLISKYVAAEITTRDCKNIGRFDMEKAFKKPIDDYEIPKLDLPSWIPPSGCGQRGRWNNYRYNWWDYLGNDLKYMFKITPTPRPPERCCDQEFWFCPNVGDNPCGIRGSGGKDPELSLPKKFQDPCVCECENPIEFDLQSGGYYFAPLDATSDDFKNGNMVADAVASVLDGSPDRFTCDIIIGGPTRIRAKVEQFSDPCGGDEKQRQGCAFKDIKKIHITGVISDLSGAAIFNSPQVVQIEEYPGEIEFMVDTTTLKDSDGNDFHLESRAQMVLSVNDTAIDACQGYKVIVAAMRVLTK